MDVRLRAIRKKLLPLGLAVLSLMIIGCYKATRPMLATPQAPAGKLLSPVGFTIQAGAFLRVENAARLTATLQNQGQDATYFQDHSGLYKVRFGSYNNRTEAERATHALKGAGIIDDFIIIVPEESPAWRSKNLGTNYLRAEITKTAVGFIGIPYLWGGSDVDSGFDCSGLTKAVYQLNGIKLPRTSQGQYASGHPVDRLKLSPGDLLFFAVQKPGDISHVGIYIGNDQFVHAPSQGKQIRLDSLGQPYYQSRFKGARSIL